MEYKLTKRKGRNVAVSYLIDGAWTHWKSTGYKTKAEVEQKLRGEICPTFEEYAKDFYTRNDTGSYNYRKKVRKKSVVEDTLYQKRTILDRYLIPKFGEERLDLIKSSEIERWFVKVKGVRFGERLSGSRSNVILSVLREILQYAVMDGIIQTNEAKKVECMNSEPVKRKPMTSEELKKMFPDDDNELINIYGKGFATYFLIFLDTGFRPCEITALRHEDIHGDSVYTERMYDTYTKEIKHRIKTARTGKKYKVGTLSEMTLRFIGEGEGLIFDIKKVNTKSAWRKFKAVALEMTGRDDVTQYQLRSAFMTNRIDRYPRELIMELMGHTKWEACYDARTPEMIIENLRTALSRCQA